MTCSSQAIYKAMIAIDEKDAAAFRTLWSPPDARLEKGGQKALSKTSWSSVSACVVKEHEASGFQGGIEPD